MVPEGGVEPPQGFSYWILRRANRLTIHIYQAITSKIKGLFSPVVPRCVRYVSVVWAHNRHSFR